MGKGRRGSLRELFIRAVRGREIIFVAKLP
jgi:hypothetical protein